MSKHLKQQLLKKYPEIPSSLAKVLDSEDMYFTGLREALFNRKKNTLDRYIDISRIVFGFFEHFYIYIDGMSSFEKLKLAILKSPEQAMYWDELFGKSAEIIDAELKSCKCKGGKHKILDLHDEIFVQLEARGHDIERFRFAGEHFKKKILTGKHPAHTDTLRDVFGADEEIADRIDELTKYWLILESTIHGIDDYVDEQKRTKEEAGADVYNIVFGLFGLTYSLIEDQKLETKELLAFLLGKEPGFERLLRDMVYQLTDLSEVPYVEKRVLGILKTEDEHPLARENMSVRASGIGVFLMLTGHLLKKEGDTEFEKLCELIKIHRVIQLLKKDIVDIPEDIRNKDYKAATAWALKHGRRSKRFKKEMLKISEYYMAEAKVIESEIKGYKKPAKKCMKMIGRIEKELKRDLR